MELVYLQKMAVSKPDLIRLLEEGEIVCRPEGKINPNSIDVSLHSVFFRQTMNYNLHDPYGPKNDLWERGTLDEEGRINIDPGETILALTEQFIGARSKYTTMLKAKSTSARLCLDICNSAGWGDPGYIDRWAFPLRNNGCRTIALRPKTWIAQIVFFQITTPLSVDESYAKTGSYQNTDDIDKLIEDWTPESVLPKPLKLRI